MLCRTIIQEILISYLLRKMFDTNWRKYNEAPVRKGELLLDITGYIGS